MEGDGGGEAAALDEGAARLVHTKLFVMDSLHARLLCTAPQGAALARIFEVPYPRNVPCRAVYGSPSALATLGFGPVGTTALCVLCEEVFVGSCVTWKQHPRTPLCTRTLSCRRCLMSAAPTADPQLTDAQKRAADDPNSLILIGRSGTGKVGDPYTNAREDAWFTCVAYCTCPRPTTHSHLIGLVLPGVSFTASTHTSWQIPLYRVQAGRH